eukprot:CAMPEP_0113506158 /NCGR_PEP_ID=MMETSP0014_2-20120614/35746_1 /TAXON_ID=2857 /ORGANISM="Nitzschia sp." /LENGTH=2030 /DNA_ID=CAMNT_0000401609 /DNA_START=758 /DNA_END=6847 /DNA_ORIENTATION=- /assembly_acc=CAM_ASM_000159
MNFFSKFVNNNNKDSDDCYHHPRQQRQQRQQQQQEDRQQQQQQQQDRAQAEVEEEEEEDASLISSAPTDEIFMDMDVDRPVSVSAAGAGAGGGGGGGVTREGTTTTTVVADSDTTPDASSSRSAAGPPPAGVVVANTTKQQRQQQRQQQQQQQQQQLVQVMNIDIGQSHSGRHGHVGDRHASTLGYNYGPPPSTAKKSNNNNNNNNPSPSPLVVRNRTRKKQAQKQPPPPRRAAPAAPAAAAAASVRQQRPIEEIHLQVDEDDQILQQSMSNLPSPPNQEEEETAVGVVAVGNNAVIRETSIPRSAETLDGQERRRVSVVDVVEGEAPPPPAAQRRASAKARAKVNATESPAYTGPIDVDEVVVSSFEDDDEDEDEDDRMEEEEEEERDNMILPVKLRYDDRDGNNEQADVEVEHFDVDVNVNVDVDGVIIRNVLNDMVDVVDRANELMSPPPQTSRPMSAKMETSQQPLSEQPQPQPQPEQPQPQAQPEQPLQPQPSSDKSTNPIISSWFSLQSSFLQRKHNKNGNHNDNAKDDLNTTTKDDNIAKGVMIDEDDPKDLNGVGADRGSMGGSGSSSSSSTINVDTPLPSDELRNVEEEKEPAEQNEEQLRQQQMAPIPDAGAEAQEEDYCRYQFHREHVDLYSSGSDDDDVYTDSSSPAVSSPPPDDDDDEDDVNMTKKKTTYHRGKKVLLAPPSDEYDNDDAIVQQTMTAETDDMITMTTAPSGDDDADGDNYDYFHYSRNDHQLDSDQDRVGSINEARGDKSSDDENSEEEVDDDDDDALQALEAFVTYAKDASPNTSSKLVDQLKRLDPVLTPLCDKSRVKTPQDILARNSNANGFNWDSPDVGSNKNGGNVYSGTDLTEDRNMSIDRSTSKPKPSSPPSSPAVAEVFAVTGSAVMAVESMNNSNITTTPTKQHLTEKEHMHQHQELLQKPSGMKNSKPEQEAVEMRNQTTSSKLDRDQDHGKTSMEVQEQNGTSSNNRNKSLLDDDDQDDSRNLIDLSYFSTTSSWGEIEPPPPTDDDMSTDDHDAVGREKNITDTSHEDKSPTTQSAASSNDDDEDAYGSYTVDDAGASRLSIGADFQDLIAGATSTATMMAAAPSTASSTMMSLSMEPDEGVSADGLEPQQKVGVDKARLILAEMDTLPADISLPRETDEKLNMPQDSSLSFMSPSAKGPVEKVDMTAPTPLVSNVAASHNKETIGLQATNPTKSARKGSVKVIKSPADDVKHADYIQLVTNMSAASITPQKSNRNGVPLSPALSCRSAVEETKPPLEDGADMQFGDTPTSPKIVGGGLFGRASPPLSPSQSQDNLILPVQEIATRIRSTNTPERVASSMKKHRKSLSLDSTPFITGEENCVQPSAGKNRDGTPIRPQKAYDDMNVSYDITASGRLTKSVHPTPKDSPTPPTRKSSFMDWLMPKRTSNPWHLWQADDDDSSPTSLPSILGGLGDLDTSDHGSEDHQSVSDLESPNLATPVIDYKNFDFSEEESTIHSQDGPLVDPAPDSATIDRDADIVSSQASELIGSTVVDDVQDKSIKSQPRPENIAVTESNNKPDLTSKEDDEAIISPSPQSLLTMSIAGCPTDEDHSPKSQEAADSLVASSVGCPADGGAIEQTPNLPVMRQSVVSASQQCPTDEGRLSSMQQADNNGSLLSATQRHPTDETSYRSAAQDAAMVKPTGVLREKKSRSSLSSLPEDEPLLCEIPTASMDDKSYGIEDFNNRRRSLCSGRCMIMCSLLLAVGIVVAALFLTGTIETNSNPSSGTLPLPPPTALPTLEPSIAPSTDSPTTAPTLEPTFEPTLAPSSPTMAPSSTAIERTSSPTTEYEGQLLWNRIETGEDVWRTFLGEQGINTPRWYFAGSDGEDESPTTGGIQLDIVNAAAERYSSDVDAVVDDYSASRAVVALNVVDVPYDVLCRPEVGKVKFCSGDFGPTQWPGTSVLFLRGDLIVAAILQINSGTSPPTTPSFMKHSICHHFGHILGVPHQKDDDSTSCMNDLRLDEQTEEIGGRPIMIPEEWQHPNDDDLDELVDIY